VSQPKLKVARANYEFRSTWRIAAPVGECWTYLTSPDQTWVQWWPALRQIDVQPTSELVGSTAFCVWRSPVGHRLRFELTITDVTASKRIVLSSEGDLTGDAVVDFAAGPSGADSELTITWTIHTTRWWMNLTAPLLRPVFTWAHHFVMKRGERGLNTALAS
jgi:uncharacterized protein YndB with AHSA1/START domain